MSVCGRCGVPIVGADAFYDRLGNLVCRTCNASGEIAAGEQRVFQAQAEGAGVPMYVASGDHVLVACVKCGSLDAAPIANEHRVTTNGRWVNTKRTYRCAKCQHEFSRTLRPLSFWISIGLAAVMLIATLALLRR
jgi:hypothetical protein